MWNIETLLSSSSTEYAIKTIDIKFSFYWYYYIVCIDIYFFFRFIFIFTILFVHKRLCASGPPSQIARRLFLIYFVHSGNIAYKNGPVLSELQHRKALRCEKLSLWHSSSGFARASFWEVTSSICIYLKRTDCLFPTLVSGANTHITGSQV